MLWFELDEDCTTSKCAIFCVLEVFCSIVVSFDIPGIFEKTNSNILQRKNTWTIVWQQPELWPMEVIKSMIVSWYFMH